MKAKMRWLLLAALLAPAAADAATTDSLTATIRPNAFYAVDITTGSMTEALALGTVNLGASTQTVKPATVTVQSTFNETELTLYGAIDCTPACTPWTFDLDDSAGETNALQAWAVFTDTGTSSPPSKGAGGFSGSVVAANNSDMLDGTPRDIGDPNAGAGANDKFERDSGAGNKDMDRLPPDSVDAGRAASHLWLYFELPPAITSDNAGDDQRITLTVTAKAPD